MAETRLSKFGVTSNEWGQIEAPIEEAFSHLMHEADQNIIFLRDSSHQASAFQLLHYLISTTDPAPDFVGLEMFLDKAQFDRFSAALDEGEVDSIPADDELRPFYDPLQPIAAAAKQRGVQPIILENILEDLPEEIRDDRGAKVHFRLTEGDTMRAKRLAAYHAAGEKIIIMYGNAHCYAPQREGMRDIYEDTCEQLITQGIKPITLSFLDQESAASKLDFLAAVNGEASQFMVGTVKPNPNLSDIYLFPKGDGQYMAVDFEKFIAAYQQGLVPKEVLEQVGLNVEPSYMDRVIDWSSGGSKTPERER